MSVHLRPSPPSYPRQFAKDIEQPFKILSNDLSGVLHQDRSHQEGFKGFFFKTFFKNFANSCTKNGETTAESVNAAKVKLGDTVERKFDAPSLFERIKSILLRFTGKP